MTGQVYPCLKCGQASSESDFCSECGARIEAGSPSASATVITPSPVTTGLKDCPACHTPRPSPDARFCEVCRYDFVKQTDGGPPVIPTAAPLPDPAPASAQLVSPADPRPRSLTPQESAAPPTERSDVPQAPTPLAPPPTPVAAPAPAPNGVKWDVVIAVDPSLDTDPDPDLKAPEDPERRIPLDKAENLIGRRDVGQSIVPDVVPHDTSVSRRHAKLLVRADGSVAILDLESANGTFVNGEHILAGVLHLLAEGDTLTMGRWTRLRIEPRGNP